MRMIDPKRHAALEELTRERLTLGVPAAQQPEHAATYRHWRWYLDDARICWVIFDKEGVSTNTLSADVLTELDALLSEAAKSNPRALVIRSAKANGFAAGAEIGDFRTMIVAAEVRSLVSRGVAVLDRLAKFPAPTVAVVHGFCLGGGLELALACRIRIARDDARLGFPEIMLGLHPGLAGTWRSLDIAADPVEAMTMMLTGRTLNARRAKRLNLVDTVVPERHIAAAVQWAADGKLRLVRGLPVKARAMLLAPSRAVIASRMAAEAEKRAPRKHYPAPYALIDLWREHGGNPASMRGAETESFARLITGETAQNLIRVFFLREKLKAYGKGAAGTIAHVHVIGAGVMGGDIAAWCVARGLRVTLQDQSYALVAPAIKRAAAFFAKRGSGLNRRDALDRLIPDPRGIGLGQADLVIEAVPEKLDIKRAVYAATEPRMKPGAILATNTSSIRLEELRKSLARPEHFIGIHFFNPVAKMPLVEVVTHDQLDPQAKQTTLAFVNRLDKLPLPVKSSPGFLVNRVLAPYILEALLAMDEGIKPELIDQVALDFGMPMGPIELADTVGLDVAQHVAQTLKGSAAASIPELPDWFAKRVEEGKLGRKTGQGLYKWVDGTPQKAKLDAKPDLFLEDRLILPLLNATMSCLRQGVVEDEDGADAGVIFGTGFAPFRGGPMHYARQRGIERIIYTLEELANQHGSRFSPDPGWREIASS
ncbi:3-hydroxyacyl-CoA dehydrogenase NAD-binding domain-containing protein [Rhodoligotrophos ferricapiens]|uniref:3-hydroxyacyl-CoA dehydrogenase NAD-binding domain-containing protein n=1 Tax=Rhodoligotrophos ferricapiens TaxID=3069264 RepID=UPI00315DD876